MRVSRWQPYGQTWNQLRQLQDEMNNLIQRWGGDASRPASAATYPPVNVYEDPDALYVEGELPGLDLKDLEMYVTGSNQLSIKGERKPPAAEKGVWHRQERGHGSFVRVLTLPVEVDRDKVEARFENGVLKVKLPKHAATKPRKINVTGS
jgi:HSP20 family protein